MCPDRRHFGDAICYDNAINTEVVDSVIVEDTLPLEVSLVFSATDGGSYNSNDHTVTWDVGTLPAGASRGVRLHRRDPEPEC